MNESMNVEDGGFINECVIKEICGFIILVINKLILKMQPQKFYYNFLKFY